MSVLTIGILGIAGALLAVELKGLKGEYGIYLVAAVGLVIFFYGVTKLKTVIETIRQVQSYIRLNRMYLEVLLKMIGITYIAEFSSGICKDAGYGSLGSQIEIFGKLSVLAVSMPILLALLDGAAISGVKEIQGIRQKSKQQRSGEAGGRSMLENGLSIDLTEIEQFIRGQGLGESVSFQNLVERLMAGDLTGLCSQLFSGLQSALFQEIGSGGRILGQILALGIFAAVFTSFSGLFQESQVSETGFFAAYLLLFTLLMTGLTQSIQVAAEAAGAIMQFMKAMMPAYFLAVALAGGSISAAAMYEFTMGLAGVSQWLLITVMIPLIRLELLMKMTGNMVKEETLSRLNDLLDQVIRWGMKVLLGVVVGFHVVQGLLLPYADSLKNGAAQKLVGMIPGIGQGAAAAAQMILGSGVLLKNAVGMAGAVVVFLILAVPMLKLLVLMLFYQCAAAILEPICDKRIISCISAAARGHQLLLQIVLTAALLFLITVSLVCAGTNVSYYV